MTLVIGSSQLKQINAESGSRFDIKEIKTTSPEGEKEARRLGVWSLPAIYVNDREAHRGSCGNKEKLRAEIERASAQAHRP